MEPKNRYFSFGNEKKPFNEFGISYPVSPSKMSCSGVSPSKRPGLNRRTIDHTVLRRLSLKLVHAQGGQHAQTEVERHTSDSSEITSFILSPSKFMSAYELFVDRAIFVNTEQSLETIRKRPVIWLCVLLEAEGSRKSSSDAEFEM